MAAKPGGAISRCSETYASPGVRPPCVPIPHLDPGTTAIAAIGESRHFIGIELNPLYAEMAEKAAYEAMLRFGRTPPDLPHLSPSETRPRQLKLMEGQAGYGDGAV